MVKFEQKEFLAPLAALNLVGTGVGIVSGAKGMIDSSTQTELQEQQLQQQKIESYKQQKAQQDQINATNNLANATQSLANNPTVSMPKPATNTISNMNMKVGMNTIKPMTKAYSKVQFKRKSFAAGGGILKSLKNSFNAPTTWAEHVKQTEIMSKDPISTVMNLGGTTSSVMGNVQASKGIKEMRSNLANMKTQSSNMLSESNNLVNDLNAGANNLRTYSDLDTQSTIKFRQKEFGFLNNVVRKYNRSAVGKAINGLGSVAADMAWDHRGKIIGSTLAGVGMAGIHYGVNKGIQSNMKRNGIDMAAIRDMQKEDQQASQYFPNPQPHLHMYADPEDLKKEISRDRFGNYTGWEYKNKAGQVVKREAMTGGQLAGQMVKEHAFGPMSLAFSGAFEIPTVVGYAKEKNNLKALSDMARARKGLAPLPVKRESIQQPQPQQPMQPQQQPQQQRMYGAVGHWISNTIRGVKKWATAPVKNTLATVDKMSGGGGLKGVSRFGDRLINAGKQNNSQFLQSAGNFVKNHQKATLATSIGLGFKVMGDTMHLGENIVNKPLRAIDPNAFAYDDYKEQQIQ